jgi:hypothetical protein
MAIQQSKFNDEKELHTWVEKQIEYFFGDVIYLPGTFIISTKRNKGGKPDGFILDISNSSWTIVESELLHHGVWEHIAEQIIRFIVASSNDTTKKKVRNYFFDEIENRNLSATVSKKFNIPETRLLQKIETILSSTTPDIAIFIDDVNEDLGDMVEALNATIKVYKIQKYIVNGNIEYLSPEGKNSVLTTTFEDVTDSRGKPVEALDLLGGGKALEAVGRMKFYLLNNGDKISLKYSRYYEDDPPYWYAISPSALEKYEQLQITCLGFILGNEGVIKLPLKILNEYIKQAGTSSNADGSIRHYHVFIKNHPKHILYTNKSKKIWDVEKFFYSF